MTDREKLLTALLQESERRAGAEVSVLDVVALLDGLDAEHQLSEQATRHAEDLRLWPFVASCRRLVSASWSDSEVAAGWMRMPSLSKV